MHKTEHHTRCLSCTDLPAFCAGYAGLKDYARRFRSPATAEDDSCILRIHTSTPQCTYKKSSEKCTLHKLAFIYCQVQLVVSKVDYTVADTCGMERVCQLGTALVMH